MNTNIVYFQNSFDHTRDKLKLFQFDVITVMLPFGLSYQNDQDLPSYK